MIALVNIYFKFSEIIVSRQAAAGIIGCFPRRDENPAAVFTAFQL